MLRYLSQANNRKLYIGTFLLFKQYQEVVAIGTYLQ